MQQVRLWLTTFRLQGDLDWTGCDHSQTYWQRVVKKLPSNLICRQTANTLQFDSIYSDERNLPVMRLLEIGG